MTAMKRRRWNVHSLRIRSAFLDAGPRFPCRWLTKKSTRTLAPPINTAATKATNTPDFPRPAR